MIPKLHDKIASVISQIDARAKDIQPEKLQGSSTTAEDLKELSPEDKRSLAFNRFVFDIIDVRFQIFKKL